MGIMQNKVTRRVAIGSIAGGLGSAALVVHALKARYGVPVPSDSGTMKVTQQYYGRDITVDVPLKRPSTPEEQTQLEEQVLAQLKKNPTYIEMETQSRKKRRDESRKETIAGYAELEKRQLADLAKQPFTAAQKRDAAKEIKGYIRASQTRALDHIDKRAGEDIAKLSKP